MEATLLKEREDVVMDKELMNKAELCQYLGVKVSTLDRLIKEGLPTLRISGRIIRFRKNEIDTWLDKKRVGDKAAKETYHKRIFKLKGKRGIFGWIPTIEKIESLAKERGLRLAKPTYPLYLLEAVLGIEEDILIDLLTRSAKEKVIELIPGRSTNIKKGSKTYQVLGKPYGSFIYKGQVEE